MNPLWKVFKIFLKKKINVNIFSNFYLKKINIKKWSQKINRRRENSGCPFVILRALSAHRKFTISFCVSLSDLSKVLLPSAAGWNTVSSDLQPADTLHYQSGPAHWHHIMSKCLPTLPDENLTSLPNPANRSGGRGESWTTATTKTTVTKTTTRNTSLIM
jgi:hypothetical protein